ncbi:MAG: choice-of-anchor D domain-containing protein, partial [Myxococcota bacterium]
MRKAPLTPALSQGEREIAWWTAVVLSLLWAGCDCGPGDTRTVRPQLVPPAEAVDFGAVPVLNEKLENVPVLNVGRGNLEVTSASIVEGGTPFSVKAAPSEVESGATMPVELSFVPPAESDYTATLVLETNDRDNPRVEVKLSGKGSTRAIMEVDPTTLDFGRVGECGAAVKTFAIRSKGTADLIVEDIAFTEGTSADFSFVGSTRTPAVVKAVGANGLPGQIQLTVKYTVALGTTAPGMGGIRVRGTDPDLREVVVSLSGQPNLAPLAVIAPLGNGAPGLQVSLDGSGSSDPDADLPLAYKWTLRQKPLGSSTTIDAPDQVSSTMRLDTAVPGEYEVELNVTDATGVKNCSPARTRIVAAPAQKLLVEMFWNHARTDMDLHVLRTVGSPVSTPPDDCFFANPVPDWGVSGDTSDDPQFLRDALTGYGPEIVGYVNPIDTTYRIVVEHAHDHLDPNPASEVTVRVYQFGVVKAEFKKTLTQRGEFWAVA